MQRSGLLRLCHSIRDWFNYQTWPEPDGFVPCIRLDQVNYSDGSRPQDFHTLPDDPWPAEPDRSGKSLMRVCFSAYGNDPANWRPASPTPGWAAPDE